MKAKELGKLLVLCITIPMVTSDFGFFVTQHTESLYNAYKEIEAAVRSDPKLMFQMKQAFFPSTNYRYWQLDGIETIPITACVTLHEKQASVRCNNTSNVKRGRLTTNTTCWNFLWTNSVLLNHIPGDILLAIDVSFTAIVYSGIIGSYSNRYLNMPLNIERSPLFCEISEDDFEQALALFLSRCKSEIRSQPDERYHGYIARMYGYFATDSYFRKLVTKKAAITHPQLSLWVTFAFLNILIPILSITRGKKAFKRMSKCTATSKPRVFIAVVLVMILFNFVYILSTLILHFQGYPDVLECYLSTATHSCNILQTATFYNYVLGILITKAIVLPVAMLIELIAAVYIARESFPTNRRMSTRFTLVIKTFFIWQLFVFVQITVGLVSIPLLVLTLISPTFSILTNGGIMIIILILTTLIASIPLPNTKRIKITHCLKSSLVTAEMLILAAFISCSLGSYYIIVKDGVDMSGIKGYIMSLLPSILFTVFVWIFKKKYFGKATERSTKKKGIKLTQRGEGFTTEEKIITFSD